MGKFIGPPAPIRPDSPPDSYTQICEILLGGYAGCYGNSYSNADLYRSATVAVTNSTNQHEELPPTSNSPEWPSYLKKKGNFLKGIPWGNGFEDVTVSATCLLTTLLEHSPTADSQRYVASSILVAKKRWGLQTLAEVYFRDLIYPILLMMDYAHAPANTLPEDVLDERTRLERQVAWYQGNLSCAVGGKTQAPNGNPDGRLSVPPDFEAPPGYMAYLFPLAALHVDERVKNVSLTKVLLRSWLGITDMKKWQCLLNEGFTNPQSAILMESREVAYMLTSFYFSLNETATENVYDIQCRPYIVCNKLTAYEMNFATKNPLYIPSGEHISYHRSFAKVMADIGVTRLLTQTKTKLPPQPFSNSPVVTYRSKEELEERESRTRAYL